jgi:phosphoglycolate phosphatase-like HAD superfamily hydrolase
VGDSPDDIEMARRAGVRAVAVRSAFSTLARLRRARPAAVLSSVEGLPGLLAASDSAGARRR